MINSVSGLLLRLSRIKMNLKYVLYTGGLTFLLITAVKCWYKCGQLKFCDKLRQRNESEYLLKLSGKLTNSLIGILAKNNTDKYFDFALTSFAGGIFNIYINDASYPRRQVNNSLQEMPAEAPMSVNVNILEDGDQVIVIFEDIKIVLYTDPFTFTAYRNDEEIVRVNSLQLLSVGKYHENPAMALDFVFPQGLRAYGLPEHAEKLSLRTTTTNGSEPYRLYNTDRFGYDLYSTEGLYGSVPVVYCHGVNSTAGVYWQNAAQTFVDITHLNDGTGIETYFMSESGSLDAFVVTGPTLKECVQQYSNLTGTTPLPQMFALGYHQSRYSYMSQEEVLEVSNKFEENDLPLDVMWLDIDYANEKKYFTWNPNTFSDPNLLLNSLNGRGRNLVAIIDPHIKREEGYFVFDECEEKGYFVKRPVGNLSYEARCWPGMSSWIDFLNPDALSYYSSLIVEFAERKNLHIWNDMNEPSVFETVEQTMDPNCMHYDGWQHRDVHNQYGFYQTMGTYEGLMERGEYQIRPFVLTRSFFAGSQRYAAHWTGDNVASWEHMKISVPMILTEALAGLSFVGADVGGFTNDPTEELLQRWYQLGAWYPFFRAHSDTKSKRREPYLFDDAVKGRIRNAILQRYKHLPYWYTLFWEHYNTGEPVIRPLSYSFVNASVFDIDDEFLVGPYILVHPVCEEQAKNVTVYLPGGENELWYTVTNNNTYYTGQGSLNVSVTLDAIPVFYRGGSIIPIKETPRNSTVHMRNDPVTLMVFLDKNNNATGTLYEDDQVSFDYLENKYTYVRFNFSNNTLENHIISINAHFHKPTFLSSVVIYGLQIDISEVYIAKNKTSRAKEGITVSIDFQNVYTCGFRKNNKTITIHNLDLDIRHEFFIKFKEHIPN